MTTIAEIRGILEQSSAPLSTPEILERLGLAGASRDEKQPTYRAIQNGVLAGHFARHHSNGGLAYSLAAPGSTGYGERARKSGTKAPKPEAKPASTPATESAPAPAIFAAKPGDFDLRHRLDAIGTDIADAIADACDAEHPHALIKALVVSREALSRAQAALPR